MHDCPLGLKSGETLPPVPAGGYATVRALMRTVLVLCVYFALGSTRRVSRSVRMSWLTSRGRKQVHAITGHGFKSTRAVTALSRAGDRTRTVLLHGRDETGSEI